jgi:hypothetical protein
MKLLAKYTHKNVTAEIYGNKKSSQYIRESGDFWLGDLMELAQKEAVNYYNCPKNNKKSRAITVIKENVKPISEQFVRKEQKSSMDWVNRESLRMGGANSGGVFTMLKNKGY